MRHKFILPSCDYNIVLTEEDAEQLIKTGAVSFGTKHSIEVFDHDENGEIRDPGILLCRNCKDDKDWGVQFVRVVVPEYRKKYIEIQLERNLYKDIIAELYEALEEIDDDIMETCQMYVVNGITLKKILNKVKEGAACADNNT